MLGFVESGITLDFPTQMWFRFEKTEPYKSLSQFSFKEMDACWFDDTLAGNETLYSIELKDFSHANAVEESNVTKRKYNIVKKNIDALQMLLSAVFETDFGQRLERQFHVDLHSTSIKIVLITIINVPAEDAQMVMALKEECQRLLKPYLRIWGFVDCHILTYEQAKKYYGTFVK